MFVPERLAPDRRCIMVGAGVDSGWEFAYVFRLDQLSFAAVASLVIRHSAKQRVKQDGQLATLA